MNYPLRSPYYGIYEYFGLQRVSYKTTLMTADALIKGCGYNLEKGLFSDDPRLYKPSDIVVNYPIFIPGVKALNNKQWFYEVSRIKREHSRHKLIIGDELNSILLARGSKDMTQSEFCVYVWQMPKMDNMLLYTNNQITGVDVIIRDATWATIMPLGHDNHIDYSVIHNYGLTVDRGLRFNGVHKIQELFDSYAPAV